MKPIPDGLKLSPFLAEPELFHLAERGDSFVRMNLFPASEAGHLLVIPKDTDKQSPLQLTHAELCEHAALMQQAALAIKQTLPPHLRPEGYTVGWNVGAAGGQSIAHSHAHVFGRMAGDTKLPDGAFMPVEGGIANVLPPKTPLESQFIATHENASARAGFHPYARCANHALIVPKRPTHSFFDLRPEEISDMVALSKHWLMERHDLDPENIGGDKGANIGWDVGAPAGQIFRNSAAMQVIPRMLGNVTHTRGGICLIKPPADLDYYQGKKTGVAVGADGTARTADLDAERTAFYTELSAKMRANWLATTPQRAL